MTTAGVGKDADAVNPILKDGLDGKPVLAKDPKTGALILPKNPDGSDRIPTNSAGNPIIITDGEGKPIIPKDKDGNPYFEIDSEGNLVLPIDPVTGKPIVPRD